MVLADANARIEWVNEGFTRATGYSLDEVWGREPGSFSQGPETDPAVAAELRAALLEHRSFQGELLSYRKDGSNYWAEIEAQPVLAADGRVLHYMAIEKDVTARKKAEENIRVLNANLEQMVLTRTAHLKQSEERFRHLAENMRDLLCLISQAGIFAYASPSFETQLGYRPDYLEGRSVIDLIHPEDWAAASAAFESLLEGTKVRPLELRFQHRSGRYVWFDVVGNGVCSPDDDARSCVLTARDISERREVAARLLASEHRYACLVENIPDAIIREDEEGRIVFANGRFLEWFGPAGGFRSGRTLKDHVAPEWRARVAALHADRMRGGELSEPFQFEGIRADGGRIWLDAFVTPVMETGCVVGTQTVLRNITARKQVELAAQAVLSKTATVVGDAFYRNMASELGAALDATLVCIAKSPAPGWLYPLAHYCEGQLLTMAEIQVPPDHPCSQVIFDQKVLLIREGLHKTYPPGVCGRNDLEGYLGIPLLPGERCAAGLLIIASTKELNLDSHQLSLVNILALRTEAELLRERSETQHAEMQARLFQSQKYEALGTLAGGVAHDFNNILTGVINYAELARTDAVGESGRVREFLGEVLKCAGRAKDLVRQILLFSRSEDATHEPVQLQRVIKEAMSLLRSTIPATVEIRSDLDPLSPFVLGNATQLHQVIMNLGINASHAMRDQGGILTITLQLREINGDTQTRPTEFSELKPGLHVVLEVTDTGCGMPPEVCSRAFEPFFTTKQSGEGTGLGLAVVHSIVRSHHGSIAIRSQVGVGTTFEICLPAVETANLLPDATTAALPRGHNERILLVDDEITVVESTKIMLERLGYRVVAVTDAEEALARIWAAPEAFNALITDLQMPGMTGIALARKVLTHRHELPIFVMSGFSGSLTPEKLRADGITGLIAKPIELSQLAAVLAQSFAPLRSASIG